MININELIKKIIISLIISGISWLVYTTVELKSELKLINYKLDTLNVVFQDIYETKKDK